MDRKRERVQAKVNKWTNKVSAHQSKISEVIGELDTKKEEHENAQTFAISKHLAFQEARRALNRAKTLNTAALAAGKDENEGEDGVTHKQNAYDEARGAYELALSDRREKFSDRRVLERMLAKEERALARASTHVAKWNEKLADLMDAAGSSNQDASAAARLAKAEGGGGGESRARAARKAALGSVRARSRAYATPAAASVAACCAAAMAALARRRRLADADADVDADVESAALLA